MEMQLRSSAHGPQMCGTPSRVTVRASTMEPAWGRRTDRCQHTGDTEGMAGRSPPPRKQRGRGSENRGCAEAAATPAIGGLSAEDGAPGTAATWAQTCRQGNRERLRAGLGPSPPERSLQPTATAEHQTRADLRATLHALQPREAANTTDERAESTQRFTIHPFGISLKRQTGGAEHICGLGGGEGWFCISFAVTVPGIHL